MGKTSRGKRDGTGPYKDSARRRSGHSTGVRRSSGQPCPKR